MPAPWPAVLRMVRQGQGLWLPADPGQAGDSEPAALCSPGWSERAGSLSRSIWPATADVTQASVALSAGGLPASPAGDRGREAGQDLQFGRHLVGDEHAGGEPGVAFQDHQGAAGPGADQDERGNRVPAVTCCAMRSIPSLDTPNGAAPARILGAASAARRVPPDSSIQ